MIYLQDIPQHYTYCFAGKDTCPKATTCLRAIAAQVLTDSPEEPTKVIATINPIYVQRLSSPDNCQFYRDNKPVRYAKGMTQLFEDLSLKQAPQVRRQVVKCFSCESLFYHSRKGTRLISPQEQENIRSVFHSAGIETEPKFDEFQYCLAWLE